MKPNLLLASFLMTLGPMPLRAAEPGLPPVVETFTGMQPGKAAGKTIREIVAPDRVRLIAMIENRGKGSPLTADFRPEWESNRLMGRVFRSDAPAREWSMLASEGILARYAIVTDDGDLFVLEVLGDALRGVPVTAVILRGDGIGCRFDLGASRAAHEVPAKTPR